MFYSAPSTLCSDCLVFKKPRLSQNELLYMQLKTLETRLEACYQILKENHHKTVELGMKLVSDRTEQVFLIQVIFTANPVNGASGDDTVVQVSYPKFAKMCEKGDTIFVGRYLVTGSEDSSIYLQVLSARATPSKWPKSMNYQSKE